MNGKNVGQAMEGKVLLFLTLFVWFIVNCLETLYETGSHILQIKGHLEIQKGTTWAVEKRKVLNID